MTMTDNGGNDSETERMRTEIERMFTDIMNRYSVSDDEGPLADEVEAFLSRQPYLTVRRHGDTVVASTNLGRERRVVLAGHLDTVPVIDNFPPRWLEPGDPLIREDIAAATDAQRQFIFDFADRMLAEELIRA